MTPLYCIEITCNVLYTYVCILVLLVKNRIHFITKLISVEKVTDSIPKLELGTPLIKTLERIRFSSNQNIGEGESNFDDKYIEKSVQLVRGSSFRNDLLQNPYFRVFL